MFVFVSLKRGRDSVLAPGGQHALCVVCDRGASELSTAAADTGVRVKSPIHPIKAVYIISGFVRQWSYFY